MYNLFRLECCACLAWLCIKEVLESSSQQSSQAQAWHQVFVYGYLTECQRGKESCKLCGWCRKVVWGPWSVTLEQSSSSSNINRLFSLQFFGYAYILFFIYIDAQQFLPRCFIMYSVFRFQLSSFTDVDPTQTRSMDYLHNFKHLLYIMIVRLYKSLFLNLHLYY